MNELDTLRPYDAAPAAMYDDVAATRARARFEQIVAFPPERVPETFDVPPRRPSRRTVMLRWAAIPAVAAVAFGVAVALPDGVGTTPAFASWTATPTAASPADLAAIESACIAAISEGLESTQLTLTDPTPAIAEQRGHLGVASFTGAGRGGPVLLGDWRESALCFTFVEGGEPVVAQFYVTNSAPHRTMQLVTTPDVEHLVTDGWGFSAPEPDGVAPGGMALRSTTGGRLGGSDFTILDGVVGADVTGVTVHADGLDVEATVGQGRFLALWPAGSDLDVSDTFEIVGARFTVTLRDGTVLDDVRPAS